jgi:gliding motility-associated-like protein
MKKFLLPLLLLFAITGLFAQPSNDECATLIDLGVSPLCPDMVWYSNLDATETDIGDNNFPTGCDGGDITFSGRDVFFQFTTDATLLDLTITVTGIADLMGSTPLSNPQVALFRGDCLFDELSLLKCGKAENGDNEISIDIFGLDPNTTYFLRINDWSTTATPNWGTFQICIDEQDPEFTLCDISTIASEGVLYDCGGPDGDYENNTTESFTICPDELNVVNGCITFGLQYFNLEIGGFGGPGDFITFYDGPDTNSPIINNVGNNGIGDDGGGGVCFVAQASSGCITVEMTTNATTVFEGFCGAWTTSTEDCPPTEVVDITPNPTDEELEDFVTTPQSFANITSVNCGVGQYGTFSATSSDLGLEKGIVLSTGLVNSIPGMGTTFANDQISTFGGSPDQDLDSLSILGGDPDLLNQSEDACVVELDVFVATNQLTFEYVFGSEEYPEFVNLAGGSSFNDIFALMVSGPGIVGQDGIGNQQNIATIPGSNTAVEINSVNNIVNTEYYRYNTPGHSVVYDGLTSDFLGVKKSLTASIAVMPCTTYHLKFAIADRGDLSYDSGVFIGELEGDVPDLSVNFASGIDYLTESCSGTSDELVITLDNPNGDSLFYDVVISGTATQDVDYTLDIPSTILIPAGETEITFPIIPLNDNIVEGTETIIVQLTANFGCGDIQLNEILIELRDLPLVEIFAGQDTAFVCSGTCLPMEANGAVSYEWTSEFPGVFDNPLIANPIACPTQSQWVSVLGTVSNLAGCSDVDSVYLQFIDPMIDVVAITSTDICNGDSVVLQAVNNVNNAGLVWTPNDFLNVDNEEIVVASPPFTETYTASVSISGCTVTDEITISVDAYDPPILTTLDTLLCQGSLLQMADSIESTSTNYQWDPTDFIITDTDIAGAVAVADADIVYTLISSSQNNFCRDTFEVNITVLPAEIEIDNGDYLELCLGDSILLTTTNSTNGVGIVWTPDNGSLDTIAGPDVWATPTETTTYFTTLTIGQCIVTDSIVIRVDSLPNMDIFAVPARAVYCQGENVNLLSETYLDENFPDIEHVWTPVIGDNSDTTNFNLNITTIETFTYTRITTNRACSETNTIEIIVIDPNEMVLTPMDTTVCTGEQVLVTASSVYTNEFSWDNNTGAQHTCTGDDLCESDLVTINAPSVTIIAEAEVEGCPIMASVTLTSVASPEAFFPVPPQVCEGESIVLNTVELGGTSYDWTTNGAPLQPNPSQFDPTVSPTVTTTYEVTMENDYCPVVTEMVTINVAGLSTLTVPTNSVFCEDETIDLSSSSNNFGNFFWEIEEARDTIDFSTSSSTILFEDNGVTPINVTVTFTNECPDTPISASFELEVKGGIPAIIITNPEPIEMNGDTCIYNEGEVIQLSQGGEPANTYEWVFRGEIIGTGPIDTVVLVEGGNLTLNLTSIEGCLLDDRKIIKVIPAIWTMPNAFTPDGDNVNDLFAPLIKGGIEIVNFRIFNRWGKEVYNNENGLAGWNGTFKGNPAPMDVYMYQIELLRPDKVTVEKKSGDVTLIR